MARRALGPAALAVAQAVEAHLPGEATGLVVACSGGADSLALAAGAAWVGPRRDLPVRGVVVDHGLQPGSERVAERVIGQLADLGVPAAVVRVEVVPAGQGPEAAARKARYAALAAAARPGELVLLGHTRDDQAETVLLGLARGSGTRSLAGMPVRRGPFLRPLLDLPRSVTAAACAEAGLVPWQDPHNDDPAYARVRSRRALAELEGALGPGLAAALARTARLAREDADLLDEWAEAHVRADALGADDLAALPAALRGRVVRRWLQLSTGQDPTSGHVAAVLDLVTAWRGQQGIDVPGGRVVRRDGSLVLDAGSGRVPGSV